MPASKLDQIYRSILLSKYFTKGWGSAENLKSLLNFRQSFSDREKCYKLVGNPYPLEITKDKMSGDVRYLEGQFKSPFDLYLPDLLPVESKNAHFQMVLPAKWKREDYKPVCIHFGGTGDHYYWRRRTFMAEPLLKEAGIGAIILENPFYGSRKPADQTRSVLNNVTDIFVMGGCLILEAIVLLQWCQRQGFGPLGVTGLSMGGHMASLVAANWPHPLILVPCLSSSTASSVFTEGVMSKAINWKMLETQYKENTAYRLEIEKMIRIQKTDAFQAGQEFIKNFPASMSSLKSPPKLSDQSELVAMTKNIDLDEKNPSDEKKTPDNYYLGAVEEVIPVKWRGMIAQIFSSFTQDDSKEYEAINFMRGIMDECTHLKNFSVPVDPSLVISVCATDDAYVPNEGVMRLSELWPGAEVRFIKTGHVAGFLLYQESFRSAIIEAFERYKKKYPNLREVDQELFVS